MLNNLSPEQRAQVSRQVQAYENIEGSREINIVLPGHQFNLEVDPFVANPEIMNSGIQLATYMAEHPELVKDRIVTDIGTGSGILGVTAGTLKAKRVFMSDIDPAAVVNAKKNVDRQNLNEVCSVFQSDLFSAYADLPKADVQIFNHPYFMDTPIPEKDWTRMMLADTALFDKYLEEAPKYSDPDATYLLSWLTLAANPQGSPDNDPEKRAPAHGYEIIKITEQQPVNKGIQQALFKIYELKYKNT